MDEQWRSALATAATMAAVACLLMSASAASQEQQFQFPGVTREIASFCAARPSLPIDLASMIVHVKRNTSFNYKLYLFSTDHVFQTGQIIPRSDFRIHSFPVKMKHINEFWPASVPTFQLRNNGTLDSVPSSSFNLQKFLKSVPLEPTISTRPGRQRYLRLPEDALGELLPGDPPVAGRRRKLARNHIARKARYAQPDLNRHVKFDRDDEVSSMTRRVPAGDQDATDDEPPAFAPNEQFSGDTIIPVSAFSSFHVNVTYLVRKDFDQREPQVIRIRVDASKFVIDQVHLINWRDDAQLAPNETVGSHTEDFNFLKHKLLRNANTRITSINQIYEDWITRNFYTIVYIQRRIDSEPVNDTSTSSPTLVNERLVFRGTSIALLGADQLDYSVRATAFITEKNGLHYYLEFLTTNKFYLCAVDWSRRPFKMIDSRQFPIKATKTLLDNEELLLCPPAVCYSNQPIDEVISYGRLATLGELDQRLIYDLVSASSYSARMGLRKVHGRGPGATATEVGVILPGDSLPNSDELEPTESATNEEAPMPPIELVKLGSSQLDTKLHLRDWTWPLARKISSFSDFSGDDNKTRPIVAEISFDWRYERAQRNDIKARRDTYGFPLTGHEIDASYRVYNELYLISSNHLISINYTLANETVTSSHPIGEEFYGLSSTLIDPITGAFYDRYKNQIYFFKGDRYVGYDYATKKPLEDFLLQAPSLIDLREAGATAALNGPPMALVSSLPVQGILGRQHHVDGVYHDLASDLVYIFSGVKFYAFRATKFKNGIFESDSLPPMRCINEHFLSSCQFDEAYPNPCREGETRARSDEQANEIKVTGGEKDSWKHTEEQALAKQFNFTKEQQTKLRSIASRGSLLDILIESSLRNNKNPAKLMEPLAGGGANAGLGGETMDLRSQDRIIVYLLIAMIGTTVLVTVAMIVILVNWTKVKTDGHATMDAGQMAPTMAHKMASPSMMGGSALGSQYLANQHHYHSRRSNASPRIRSSHRPTHHIYATPQYPGPIPRSRVTSDFTNAPDKPLGPTNGNVSSKGPRQVGNGSHIDNSIL